MKANPLRMGVASLLLALFIPQMATTAEAQFTDDHWVIGTPATAPACCIGEVHALVTDADGNLYAGGPFLFDGSGEGGNVARWDGSEWSPLGAGMNGAVNALAFSGNDLYAAGSFTSAGGMAANNIAQWDGRAWSALGAGVDSSVSALAVSGDDLYAVVSSRYLVAPYIAKWDGHEWSRLELDWVNALWDAVSVEALAVSGSDLYVAGQFTSIGGVAANHIAKWDGSTWSPLDSGVSNDEWPPSTRVSALAVSGTDLYAVGDFSAAGGVTAHGMAKWDGSTWSALGSGVEVWNGFTALAVLGTDVIVGGGYDIAKWDGREWSVHHGVLGANFPEPGPLGGPWGGQSGPPGVLAISILGTDVFIGGGFDSAGDVAVNNIAKWDGSAWSRMGPAGANGFNGAFSAFAIQGKDVYAGGRFNTVNSIRAKLIAKWDGSAWSPLGEGIWSDPWTRRTVTALEFFGTDLYVGGVFTQAGGVEVNNIARWDGREWSKVGAGIDGAVYKLAASDDALYAGGSFTHAGGVEVNHIAKWDGREWSPLGAGMDESVSALAVSGSDLYAAGWFTTAGGKEASRIAKWEGREWSPLGVGMNGWVQALAVSGTDLYAIGSFTSAGGIAATNIAKWDGIAWSSLGAGIEESASVGALAVSGTDVYVGFIRVGEVDGKARNTLARWDGSAWSFIGPRLTPLQLLREAGVSALAVSGRQLYAGTFATNYDTYSRFFARLFLDGVPPLEVADGRATVFFRNIPAGGYSIERTTDLETWEHLATRYAGTTGGIDFLDETAPGDSAYYRAVPLEP
jgi:trimeric autotransporter adhesin